jgi:hypothetical protein
MLVGEEGRLVEGGGGESFVVGVERRTIRVPLLAKVCLALSLLVSEREMCLWAISKYFGD